MKCEYCGKATRDMPNHLTANPMCLDKHKKKLQKALRLSADLAIRNLSGYRGQNKTKEEE
jgi:hypothetical protein